jgi:hypothetical protein
MFVFSFACDSVPALRRGEGGGVGDRYRRLTDASFVTEGGARGKRFLWMANR